MIIRAIAAGLGLAVAALFTLLLVCGLVSVPGWTAGLHPDCNVTMPCVAPAGRASRANFGGRMSPPTPAKSPLGHGTAILPHPVGCPRAAFCGCGASVEVFGRPIRSLWLAANWLRFPRAHPAPGMVAARRGHVFVIREVLGGGKVLAYDANSGGRKTRLHVRSLAGFTVVDPSGAVI